jgi:pantothenate kinase
MSNEQQKADMSEMLHMARLYLTRIGMLLLVAALWVLFISYINTRSTEVTVHVSGSVDEVLFYKTSDEQTPVATIQTNGKDVTQKVLLRNGSGFSILTQTDPEQYYFVTKQGSNTYHGGIICCQMGIIQRQETLDIKGLDQWQQTK